METRSRTRSIASAARHVTAAGGDVTDLLRAYRVGHQLLWRLWSEHVYAEIRQPELLPAVLPCKAVGHPSLEEDVTTRNHEAAPHCAKVNGANR